MIGVERFVYGPRNSRSIINTVLESGVPATTRTAFENDFAALGAGNVSPDKARTLAQKYPNVANAYSPDQWKRLFQDKGLDAKTFGAVWTPVR